MSTAPAVQLFGPAQFEPYIDAAAEIYGAAMHRTPSTTAGRRDLMRTHLTRPDFAAAVAIDDNQQLLGFGYGYRGRNGQWWHDVVSAAIGRPNSTIWLSDTWELAEFHVDPAHHHHGIGRSIIELLLPSTIGETVVLSTHDLDTPARRLYRSLGFIDLLSDFRFPGSNEVYAVMGMRR